MEAEEELERLHGEVPLFVPAGKEPESVPISLPEVSFPFPAQRQNLFPMGCLEGIPAASTAQESELPPLSADLERVSALRKPYPWPPIQFLKGFQQIMDFILDKYQDLKTLQWDH